MRNQDFSADLQRVCMLKQNSAKLFVLLLFTSFFSSIGLSQEKPPKKQDDRVRTVTIPISIFTKKELKENQRGELVQTGDLQVKENGDNQVILSIRSVSNTPLALAVLIQDDLTSEANLKLDELREFIRQLPRGSRVMVAYLQAEQFKFVKNLLRIWNERRKLCGLSREVQRLRRVVLFNRLKKRSSDLMLCRPADGRFCLCLTVWTFRAVSKAPPRHKASTLTARFFGRRGKV